MSVYYELRYTGILSFKDKNSELDNKIKHFIIEASEKAIDTKLTLSMSDLYSSQMISKFYKDRIELPDINYDFILHNNFKDGLKVLIKEIEPNVFNVDFCVGNKNHGDELELLTLLLVDYMDLDFRLIYYNDVQTYKLSNIKKSLEDYIIEEHTYPDIYMEMNIVERSYKGLGYDFVDGDEHNTDWLYDDLD